MKGELLHPIKTVNKKMLKGKTSDAIADEIEEGKKSIRTIKNAIRDEEHYVMLPVRGSRIKKNNDQSRLLVAHCCKLAVAADLDIVRTAAR